MREFENVMILEDNVELIMLLTGLFSNIRQENLSDSNDVTHFVCQT